MFALCIFHQLKTVGLSLAYAKIARHASRWKQLNMQNSTFSYIQLGLPR